MLNPLNNTYTTYLGYWIKRYTVLANRTMDAALKAHGIGRTQWYILLHIHEAGVLSQRELQERMEIKSATLTPLVGALVRKGFVEQRPHPADGRGKTLTLSPAGKRLWRRLPDPLAVVRSKALQGIKAEDVEMARRVLEAAVHNLEGDER